LRLKELQLSVQELQVRLGEDDLRQVVHAGATANVAGLSVAISRVSYLDVGGVADRRLRRHRGRHFKDAIKRREKDTKRGLKTRKASIKTDGPNRRSM
jgi:hypothetical protein